MNTISNRIKKIREQKGMTITALSDYICEKRQRLQDIEMGKQRIPEDVLVKFIEHFNIDANWLLTGQGEMYRTIHQSEFDPQTLAIARMAKDLDPVEKSSIESFVSDKKFIHEMKRRDMRQSA